VIFVSEFTVKTAAFPTLNVTLVAPVVGRTSPHSDTPWCALVTVSGTGFALGKTATIFKFGSVQSTSVNCTSATKCTATAPAHEVGTVHVKATVNKATSVNNAPADRFTFN